jgi:effector-binding domain-containing protein
MSIKKKIWIGCSVFFTAFLGWYFLIKQSDYTIHFKVQAARATVHQGIKEWAASREQKEGVKYVLTQKSGLSQVSYTLTQGQKQVVYDWEVVSKNDSVVSVNVGITDINQSWYNKLTVPFFETDFKKEQLEKITDFKKGLDTHLKNFKVKIEGPGNSNEEFVAYIALKSVIQEKAQTMIANDAIITGFLYTNKIKITGRPYVEVTNWDQEKETLEFNYCFPVAKNTKIIPHAIVKFKTLPVIKGLKATYYGNFRTSDRAWFALQDYAERNNLQLEHRVLEHFLANPFNGGDELKWETKVIIPFQNK